MFLSVHNSMPSTDLLGVFLMRYGSTLLFTDVVRSTPCSSTILNPTSPCERKATRSAPLCKSTSHLHSKGVFGFTISPFESICYIQMLWRACKNCTVRINSVCLYTMYSVYTKKEGFLDKRKTVGGVYIEKVHTTIHSSHSPLSPMHSALSRLFSVVFVPLWILRLRIFEICGDRTCIYIFYPFIVGLSFSHINMYEGVRSGIWL